MLIRITSAKCVGITALPIQVEIQISKGIGLHLVGLADAAVKESLLRTTTALDSLGLHVPGKKIVINLAPADMHKKGSGYDLPIALGILAASEQMEMPGLGKYLIMGELGLDGKIRHIPGALPIVELAGQLGLEGCILPYESALESAEFRHGRVFGVRTLTDALMVVGEKSGYERFLIDNVEAGGCADGRPDDEAYGYNCMDFSEIVGQENAKRGLEIAAAGSHNLILIGSPGSGKSSLAKAMCKILPPMTLEESIQTSKIYSVAGLGDLTHGLIRRRPFRCPHNTASVPALIGGGSDSIMPGEVSLSHNGILFLDEFFEIPRRTIEVLRAPMEDKKIVISRLRGKVEYPADFTLVAATNPCPCGYYGEGDRCTCSVGARMNYMARMSGPLSDRIDLQIICRSIKAKELINKEPAETSEQVARRVAAAREVQRLRFEGEGIFCNSQMDNRLLDKYCPLDAACKDFLEKAMERMQLSARACTRIIKIARTIADLSGSEDICIEHLAEALAYRILDKER